MKNGAENSNYRHGRYVDPRCGCGRRKDPRSSRCAVCAKVSQPLDGEGAYDSDDMRLAIEASRSLSEAARSVGCSRATITRFARDNEMLLDHMRRSRGRLPTPETVYRIWDKRDNGSVRKFLRQTEPDNYFCEICGQEPKWNGMVLVLQMDHINGNRCDNRRENLRWLCPNCHTQTPTFTGRNARRKEKNN